jgi:hypothetical protein
MSMVPPPRYSSVLAFLAGGGKDSEAVAKLAGEGVPASEASYEVAVARRKVDEYAKLTEPIRSAQLRSDGVPEQYLPELAAALDGKQAKVQKKQASRKREEKAGQLAGPPAVVVGIIALAAGHVGLGAAIAIAGFTWFALSLLVGSLLWWLDKAKS